MKTPSISLIAFMGLFLTAPLFFSCGRSANLTAQEHIQRAKDFEEKGKLNAAIIEYKNALLVDANSREARFLLGQLYLKSHLGAEAETTLRRAQELGVNADSIKIPLSEALLLQGQFGKVLKDLQSNSAKSDHDKAIILRIRADAMMGLKQRDQACALYQQSVNSDAKYAPAYRSLAKCAMARKDFGEAKKQLDLAVKTDPADPDTWVVLGDFERSRSDFSAAAAAYSQALKAAPNYPDALAGRALAYLFKNKLDQARADSQKLREIAPKGLLTYFVRAALNYEKGDYQGALASLQEILKERPDFMPALRLAGLVQYQLKSYEQSAQNLGRYLGEYPDDVQIRKLLAAAYLQLGRREAALAMLKPLVGSGLAPDSVSLALAGTAYLKANNAAAAAEQFEKAVAIDPQDPRLYTQLGWSLVSAGRPAEGIAELKKGVALEGEDLEAEFRLVLAYLQQKQFDAALSALSALEKKRPPDPNVYILQGAAYLGKGERSNARNSFERAVAVDPLSNSAQMDLAQLDLIEKNPEGARKRLRDILARDKGYLPALIALAKLARSEGNAQEYVSWMEKAVAASPSALEPRVTLARYYLGELRLQKALALANEANNLQPKDAGALEVLGAVQFALHDMPNALVTFKRLVAQRPDSPSARYQLASVYVSLGNLTEARAELNEALRLKPGAVDAKYAVASLDLREGKYEDALEIARQLQKSAPQSALGLTLEGDVRTAQKEYAQAVTAYQAAETLEGTWALTQRIFDAYAQAGQREAGEQHILQWLKKKPEDKAARLYLAQAYMLSQQYPAAVEQYQALLEQEPDNAAILNNLAWLYEREKDPRALEFAERAYKRQPDAAFVLDTLGWILVERGELARGRDLLQRAVNKGTDNPETTYHLAVALAKSGDHAGARRLLEDLVASQRPFPQLAEAKELLKKL